MRFFLWALLFIPLSAVGEHHRGHALMHLNEVTFNIEWARDQLERYQAALDPDSFEWARADTGILYLSIMLGRHKDAIEALECLSCTNLDDVRRLVNQPDIGPLQGISLVQLANRQFGVYQSLVDNVVEAEYIHLKKAMQSTSKAWRAFDLAAWHIQDAIREEIYQDPAFICSGPNNHCE